MLPFTPQYILQEELTSFGLPGPDTAPDIISLVQMASALIDEACGRITNDGSGSLVYTTYTQRILLPGRSRNLIQCPMKPIVALSQDTITALQNAASGTINNCYTGALANTIQNFTGSLSGIVGASGRYGYTRQDMQMSAPDLFAMINPLNLMTMFGGPAPFLPIDVSYIDYDMNTGEIWLPAGLQLQRYTEVILTYNSGYNPLQMPWQIKHVCAAVVKNAMAKGSGTTGMLTMTLRDSGFNATMSPLLLDATLHNMLTPFINVRTY